MPWVELSETSYLTGWEHCKHPLHLGPQNNLFSLAMSTANSDKPQKAPLVPLVVCCFNVDIVFISFRLTGIQQKICWIKTTDNEL